MCFSLISIFFLILLPNIIFSQTFQTLQVTFERCTKVENKKETIKGNIYYQGLNRVVLKVTEPVLQWMILEGNTMLIYYPNERKAFRFISKNPFSLPFFQAFIGVLRGDFGLSEAGFKLARKEVRKDTLLTLWEPPKQAKRILGTTIVGLVENRLAFAEVQDAKGERLIRTTYSNHFQYGVSFLPLEIISVRYQKRDSIIEKVIYAVPQFNVTLPQEVTNFKIPEDIKIKGVEW